jgi:hypothetical protein
MARTPDVLHDPTPIDAPGVDVGIRVAWLLRMSRSAGTHGSSVSVTDMATLLRDQGVAATPPSVSGWETGRVPPSTAVVEAYERALDLEPGGLRGAIDMMRRTFGLEPRPAHPAPPDLHGIDRAVERVLVPGPISGGDWLHFCDAALAVRPGLPTHVTRPLVERLVSELSRSVFTAYLTRYEGLSLLRCGQYADLVLEVLRDYVDEPGNQVVAEAMSVLAERADRSTVEVLASHLGTDDPGRLRGAVLGLENLHVAGRLSPAHWQLVVEPFLSAYDRGADDEELWTSFSAVWHLLPQSLRTQAEPRLRRPVRPLPAGDLRRDLRSEQEFARDLADRVCAAHGLVRQPLLARLVHEATFDHRRPRSFASAHLLMASPLRSELGAQVAATMPDQVDPALHEAAAELLVALGDRRAVPHARRWVRSGEVSLVGPGLVALAHVGEPLERPQLLHLLEQPDPVGRRALYHAGMTSHPEVARIAADRTHPLATRAQWWQRHGGAVTT